MKRFKDFATTKYEFRYTRDSKETSFFIFAANQTEAWEKWNKQYGKVYTVLSVKEMS
jgi:hypothetical protein